jgi:5'(3')-deoxyribonucleotidase
MSNKEIIGYFDFDDTIVNSHLAMIQTYNIRYDKNLTTNDVTGWKLADYMPEVKSVDDIFGHPIFYDVLEFNEGAVEYLQKLQEYIDVVICTMGTPMNISLKSLWIGDNLPFINHVCYITGDEYFNKNKLDMSKDIIIDDRISILDSANAKHKFLFGRPLSWNKDNTKYPRVETFAEIYETIKNIVRKD